MSKRLVMCCDGTWNFPDQQSPTNVTKVALAVAPEDHTGGEQRVFYHHGVGTGRWERLRGGAFGFGVSRDVRDTYRFIVQNYEPGDELFFFGFSRGAFTARSTAGFVRNAGILRPDYVDRVDEAYALYRSRTDTKTPRGREATLFRRSYSYETRIRFIGVWDTVGALGIPVDGLNLVTLFNRRFKFHNTDLSTSVDSAYHAMAIDEQRRQFKPTLWNQQNDAPKDQVIQQVWFPGVHSDIGGGYEDHGLSDVALLWMVDRARSCDLEFRAEAFPAEAPKPASKEPDDVLRECTRVKPNPLGKLNKSRKGLYRLQSPLHRKPEFTVVINEPKEIRQTREYISPAAVERRDADGQYAPTHFITYLDEGEPLPPQNEEKSTSNDVIQAP
jgi:uncharacterized protein (DUF2235 family)